jgi:hypothetical protein
MSATVKGRHTIKANTPKGRRPRLISPWTFETKPDTILAKLEKSYLDALEAVDVLEVRKATAEKSGTLTPQGLQSDVLNFAAS